MATTQTPPRKAQPHFSTPIHRKTTGATPFQAQPPKASTNKKNMCREATGLWVGPCPVEEFMEEFLPLSEADADMKPPAVPKDYFADKKVTCEKDLYKILGVLINGDGDTPRLLPGFEIVDTSNHPDPSSKPGADIRMDLSFNEEGAVTTLHPNDMGITLIGGEIKDGAEDIVNDAVDPLPKYDTEAPYEITANDKKAIRGQLASYATQVCLRQHRTHFFMLFMFRPYARLLRWDRSGVIVTKRFNYMKDCLPLVEFLWRFTLLDRAGKGFDPTVTAADETETEHAHRVLRSWAPSGRKNSKFPVFKMEVPDTNGDEPHNREFLVWGALAEPLSPLGRCTRGYPAVEVTDGILSEDAVFLKEQWRSASVKPEVETLGMLNSNHVVHVPTLLCGGDLAGQVTRTQEFAKRPWRVGNKTVETRIHTRFVVKEVGIPLERFPSSKTLLSVVFDAFEAHREAYEKCHILHRDISGGNILILPDGSGLLNDWDMAREISELGNGRGLDRTGTWPFMSIELLGDTDKIHAVRDDLESFFWVALYYGLHYLQHTHFSTLPDLVELLFNDYRFIGPKVQGGAGKSQLLDGKHIGMNSHPQFAFLKCSPLTRFVEGVLEALDDWKTQSKQAIRKRRISRDTKDPAERLWLADPLSLRHSDMAPYYANTLVAEDWPKGDKAMNQMTLWRFCQTRVRPEKRSAEHLPKEKSDGAPATKKPKTLPFL